VPANGLERAIPSAEWMFGRTFDSFAPVHPTPAPHGPLPKFLPAKPAKPVAQWVCRATPPKEYPPTTPTETQNRAQMGILNSFRFCPMGWSWSKNQVADEHSYWYQMTLFIRFFSARLGASTVHPAEKF
jgi:hypothetical protein